MPPLSLAEAAKETGRGRTTIWKAIKSGKLSASRGDNGEWQIDPSELSRAFPPEPPHERPRGRRGMDGDGAETAREAALEAENTQLRERLSDKDAQIADVMRERDRWQGEAGKWQEEAAAIRLLSAPPARARSR